MRLRTSPFGASTVRQVPSPHLPVSAQSAPIAGTCAGCSSHKPFCGLQWRPALQSWSELQRGPHAAARQKSRKQKLPSAQASSESQPAASPMPANGRHANSGRARHFASPVAPPSMHPNKQMRGAMVAGRSPESAASAKVPQRARASYARQSSSSSQSRVHKPFGGAPRLSEKLCIAVWQRKPSPPQSIFERQELPSQGKPSSASGCSTTTGAPASPPLPSRYCFARTETDRPARGDSC